MDTHEIWHYWWLIFPIMWMVTSIVRMVMRNEYRRQKLQILKSYLDRGQTPPADLNL